MAKLKLAVYQNDSAPGDKQVQLERLAKAAVKARENDAKLLLCPELFMTGYYIKDQVNSLAESADGPFIQASAQIAKDNQLMLVFGYPERSEELIYNAAVVINKQGERVCNYRKLHLPGEFENKYFQTDSRFVEFEIEGIPASILICYDCEYPEAVRKVALLGTHLLLIPTALSKPYGVVAQKLIPTRAFENGIFIAYADCCGEDNGLAFAGQSCIVDPLGNDLARAGMGEEIIYASIDTDEVAKAQNAMPYLKQRRPELY